MEIISHLEFGNGHHQKMLQDVTRKNIQKNGPLATDRKQICVSAMVDLMKNNPIGIGGYKA